MKRGKVKTLCMKRKIHGAVCAVITALTLSQTVPAKAEDPTLKSLVTEALANNPEIAARRERSHASIARTRYAGALEDPTLKIEMEDLDSSSPMNISPGNSMLTRYTLSQSFPFPGKRGLREEMAGKEASAADSLTKATELDIIMKVKQAYFDLAFYEESIRLTNEIKELLSSMSKVAQGRYSTAQATQLEVLKVEVELAMATNDLTVLEASKAIAGARLKSILNRGQDDTLPHVPGLSKAPVAFNASDLAKKADSQSPLVKMLEAEAGASELEADLMKKEYYPDLMLGVAPIQRDGRFDYFDVMVQVNIPIWFGKYENKSGEASHKGREMRLMAKAERNAKAYEIKAGTLMAQSSERMMGLYEASIVPQAALSFESAMKNYQAGRMDLLTLIDTERVLKKTRLEYLKTVLDYWKNMAELEKTAGTEIF